MGKPDATEEEVYEAARKARCYDFIMALPDGFQTVVGEGGATLSGGEKQRVALIRNLMFKPKVLLLDEVTAGLDADNKKVVHMLISSYRKSGGTVIAVTHDTDELRQAEQIIRIEEGRIIEQ